ncbi:MAG: DNA-directed RNA polymerase subunit omega [Gallicola sp.]|nr:DNA-directed RNA polymerase subunit omega [Gallicola sp.]
MINPSFEELSKISNSRYAISVMVSKRARRIIAGSEPLADVKRDSAVTQALEEIVEGKVVAVEDEE